MLPVILLQLSSLIFCSVLRKTYSCLLHLIRYWYRHEMLSTYGEISQSPSGFSDQGNNGRGRAKSKIQAPIAVLPLNCYLTQH